MLRRALLFALVFAMPTALFPQSAHAQLPDRLQRCLPYPTFAEEVSDLTPTPAPKKQYFADEIHFDGDTQLTKAELEKVATALAPRTPFSEPDFADQVAEAARGEWQDRGYFRAEVTASTELLSHDPSAEHYAVNLHVKAKKQYRTGTISLSGTDDHRAFPLDELRRLVLLQEGDLFDTSKLRASFDALKKRYGDAGYIDFTSEPQFDIDGEKGVVNLILKLYESKQFRIAKVEVYGADSVSESALRSAAPIGEIFNYHRILVAIDENKSRLPEGAGPDDIEISRYQTTGTVCITFNFWSCPAPKN
jgi:outer membrane protein assembly factor BamA